MNGGERGIRTLDAFLRTYTISNRALSTTQTSLLQNYLKSIFEIQVLLQELLQVLLVFQQLLIFAQEDLQVFLQQLVVALHYFSQMFFLMLNLMLEQLLQLSLVNSFYQDRELHQLLNNLKQI